MKFERGALYETRGGWKAEVIWVCFSGFYAIHKPGESDESIPVWHLQDGTAQSALAVHEPPCYNGHPADLLACAERRGG